jgi:hypothetical protein
LRPIDTVKEGYGGRYDEGGKKSNKFEVEVVQSLGNIRRKSFGSAPLQALLMEHACKYLMTKLRKVASRTPENKTSESSKPLNNYRGSIRIPDKEMTHNGPLPTLPI